MLAAQFKGTAMAALSEVPRPAMQRQAGALVRLVQEAKKLEKDLVLAS